MTPASGPSEKKILPEDDRSDESPSLEKFIMYYFENSALWPIVAIIVAHLVVGNAFALITAIRDLKFVGLIAVSLAVVGSVQSLRWEYKRRGQAGIVSAMIGVIWALTFVTAYFANLYRIL